MLAHRNMVANLVQVDACGAAPSGRQGDVITPLPLYHMFSLTGVV